MRYNIRLMTTLLPNRITLIGMSGVGKTSIGKLLAQKTNYAFIDTDTMIRNTLDKPIHLYIKQHSESDFLALEENIITSTSLSDKLIIATGGSVIYSPKIMTFLNSHTTIIYLKDSLENIQKRISSFKTRGLIKNNKKTLKELFSEREVLYKNYATITVQLSPVFNIENEVQKLIQIISEHALD
jgi:shikimate kinase